MTGKELMLDPDAVRQRASSIPDCTELPSNSRTTLSFLRGERTGDLKQLARVIVFCDTGTVATGRYLGGAIRQTFRRNVNTLDALERLLHQPPTLTAIDTSLVSLSDEKPANDGPKTTQSTLELMDCGLAVLQAERDKLQSHLDSLQQPTQPAAPEAPPEMESIRYNPGSEFQFSLPAEAMKHVDQCLADIRKMGRLVKGVATNGKGTVFLYGHGGVAYTPHIPRGLHHKLAQLRQSKTKSRPDYVSLGTRDRFFVAFQDTSFAYKGPKGLDRELKKSQKPPRSVAFGASYDTYFVVFHDGSWAFQGRDIPEELSEKLAVRRDKDDLVAVSLGPTGEWFLRAENGRLWWGGVSDDLDDAIQHLIDTGHYLNFLDFGDGGSYFVSYD